MGRGFLFQILYFGRKFSGALNIKRGEDNWVGAFCDVVWVQVSALSRDGDFSARLHPEHQTPADSHLLPYVRTSSRKLPDPDLPVNQMPLPHQCRRAAVPARSLPRSSFSLVRRRRHPRHCRGHASFNHCRVEAGGRTRGQLSPTHNFWVVEKLSENFLLVGKLFGKRCKIWV